MTKGAIEVRGISKRFRIQKEPSRMVKEAVLRLARLRLEYEDFWALKEVNLTISPGESVGIIGRNGSGKSTLFKLISGVLKPTSGSVTVCGRVSPMIELRAGFQSELTGIENIYLNGAIYGMKKDEIKRKLEGIVDFAGIGHFIYSPVRTYSSGMMARLGFAVAVNVDADIMLVDEVLSVGDANFRQKCYEKIGQIKKEGVTLVYVSHDMATVTRICDRVVWLDRGHVVLEGRAEEVTNAYLAAAK